MKAEKPPEKPVDEQSDLHQLQMEMLNLLWVIKRGLEGSDDRTLQLSQLRKDHSYLKRILREAAVSTNEDVWRAAARIQEILREPGMSTETEPKTAVTPSLTPVIADSQSIRGKRLISLLMILLTLGVLIGVVATQWQRLNLANAQQTAAVPPAAPTASAKVVLRIHGSNTLGSELLPAIAEAFLKQEGAKTVQRIQMAPNEWRIEGGATLRSTEPVAIEIEAHGSATAFKDLVDGTTDIGAASRPIKKEEAQALNRFGDMTSPMIEHVVGLDGIAVIINPANTVRALTKTQIAQIFAGQISDWSDVGGVPGPIHIFARDEKSGTFDTFQNVVLGKDKISDKAMRLESSEELSDKVAADAFGIGFIGLPYIRNARAVAVADGETLPMLPTTFTVATEDYPLARRLYLYAPLNPQNDYLRAFVEFALADAGQQLVNQKSFISQTVTATKPVIDSSLPSRYARLIRSAERLSLSFRFRSEVNDLDSKAQRDLDRVVNFLTRNPGRQVMLLGFTDNNGDPVQNQEISKKRAQEVERELAARGIFPTVVEGFGPLMPVANNGNPQSAEKNRRVEIWMM